LRVLGDVDDERVLTGVIYRDVLVRLEEAQLADAFCADAAGGEIGDAAGFKFQANVGNIGMAGEDGQADGTDFLKARLRHLEDDVEVVDHEVEDDVDVERARGEDAEAMTLEEHRAIEMWEKCGDGGVEAFEMADLENEMAG